MREPKTDPWPAAAEVGLFAANDDAMVLATLVPGGVDVWRWKDRFTRIRTVAIPATDLAIGWDPQRRAIIVRGLTNAGAAVWTIDPASGALELVKRASSGPPVLPANASLTPTGERALLFGGAIAGAASDRSWFLSPVEWTPGPTGPGARSHHAAWPSPGGVVVMGGLRAGAPLSDAWRLVDGGWAPLPWTIGGGLALGDGAGFSINGEERVIRSGAAEVFELQPLRGVFEPLRTVALPEPLARPRAVTAPSEAFVVGSTPRGTLIVKAEPRRVTTAIDAPVRDVQTCFAPDLGALVIAGTPLTAQDGGAVRQDLSELDDAVGGPRLRELTLTDAFGDRAPSLSGPLLLSQLGGRCWILRDGEAGVEAWELRSESTPAAALEINPAVLSRRSGAFRVVLEVRMETPVSSSCLVHLDGSWRVVGEGPSCTFDGSLFPPLARAWRVALRLNLGAARRVANRIELQPPLIRFSLR